MKYDVYRQGPEEREVPSQFPALDSPWKKIGSIESESEPKDLDWAKVIMEVTGKSLANESDRGAWYKVIPEY